MVERLYLLRDIFHMLPHQVVACRVEEDGEAPWIAKGDQMGFSWVVFHIQNGELGDLLSRELTLVYPVSKRRV